MRVPAHSVNKEKSHKMVNLMSKRKPGSDEPESRKRSFTPEDLKKIAADLGRISDRMDELAKMMDRAGIESIDADGYLGVYGKNRGIPSISGFIMNVTRELGLRGVF